MATQPLMNAIIRKDVTQVPGGYAITGFFDMQMTITDLPAPLMIAQKLPFQVLVIQSQNTTATTPAPMPSNPPAAGPSPSLAGPGLLTAAPVVSINNVLFDGASNTELAQLSLEGFISKDQPPLSSLSFTAASTSHQLKLTADGQQMTVTCSTNQSDGTNGTVPGSSGDSNGSGATGILTVTGTGTATLNNQKLNQPGFTLNVRSSGEGQTTYDMVVTDGTNQIFTTNGEISPISPDLLLVFCPTLP